MDKTAKVVLTDDASGASLAGELDLGSYDTLATDLGKLFDVSGDIVLDLADVTFIDSSAIRLFVRLQESRNGEGSVILRGVQPHVARVLDVAGVSDLGITMEGSGA